VALSGAGIWTFREQAEMYRSTASLRGSINNYPHYLEFDTGGIEMLPHHDAVGGYVCDHPYDRSKKANTYDSHTMRMKKCTVRTSLHVRLQSKDVDSDSGRSHSDEWYRDTPTKLLRPDPVVHDMIHNLHRPDME
jgi:hypothetical protein